MSDDTKPVIHTVGSVDRPDQTNLRDETPGSTAGGPSRAPDSKLHNTEHREEEFPANSDTAAEPQNGATSPHTSNDLGVIGEIRTVGSAGPAGGDAGPNSGIETQHDQ